MEHYYRVDIFYITIDKQLQELYNRFSERALELRTLTSVLGPKDCYKAFDADQICTLVEKYYPLDFTTQEQINLRYPLQHFICKAQSDDKLRNLSTLQELCQHLADTGK